MIHTHVNCPNCSTVVSDIDLSGNIIFFFTIYKNEINENKNEINEYVGIQDDLAVPEEGYEWNKNTIGRFKKQKLENAKCYFCK